MGGAVIGSRLPTQHVRTCREACDLVAQRGVGAAEALGEELQIGPLDVPLVHGGVLDIHQEVPRPPQDGQLDREGASEAQHHLRRNRAQRRHHLQHAPVPQRLLARRQRRSRDAHLKHNRVGRGF